MMIDLEFLKKFSKQNIDFVIFLTKLNELKSINYLPFDYKIITETVKSDSNLSNNLNVGHLVQSKLFNTFISVRVILINDPKKIDVIKIGSELYSTIKKRKLKETNFIFSKKLTDTFQNKCCELIFGFFNRSYTFSKYKKSNSSNVNIKLNIFNQKTKFKDIQYYFNLSECISLCKDLQSEPANILTPSNYAERCRKLKKYGLKVKILDKQKIEEIGMGALLGVSQGSVNEPSVVIIEWNLTKTIKPTILVGKGVTFDSGGISLKPAEKMEEMIYDMSGSAVVVASMLNAALNKIKKPLVGIIGLVENMPDGNAQRPGDIVKSLSGQTIEVLNTDAEGRLVLADLLTYVQKKYKPREIIDFATLTGAVVVALGQHKAGLISNNDKLASKIYLAGENTSERVWRLPLGKEYNKEMDSDRADMRNTTNSSFGSTITASQFLQRFIKDETPWAHLDIAGVAWNSRSYLHKPGVSAFGVRLIDRFLKK